ncbi:hypothetical protein Ae331Ps2_4468c [Pseudonocardia sp. Ae331_Ps2]|nr:hypothetical protein Ae331Ps2_4468c [Pseudonocardia sp. Ae331_Ps2]
MTSCGARRRGRIAGPDVHRAGSVRVPVPGHAL